MPEQDRPLEFNNDLLDRTFHTFLLILPNLFNPIKLRSNIQHPLYEWIHTAHKQSQVDTSDFYIVEHYFGGQCVTFDLVETDKDEIEGMADQFRKLFSTSFYYGHCEYFPQKFQLVERNYVNDTFNREEYLKRMWVF